jgi:hypothetical protein
VVSIGRAHCEPRPGPGIDHPGANRGPRDAGSGADRATPQQRPARTKIEVEVNHSVPWPVQGVDYRPKLGGISMLRIARTAAFAAGMLTAAFATAHAQSYYHPGTTYQAYPSYGYSYPYTYSAYGYNYPYSYSGYGYYYPGWAGYGSYPTYGS